MTDSVKILPAVVICCGLLFALKSVGLWSDLQTELAGISEAQAAGTPKEAKKSKKESHKEEKKAKSEDHGASKDDAHGKDDGDAHHDSHAEDAKHTNDPVMNEHVDEFSSTDLVPSAYMSASEVEVLESLSNRRKKIDERNKELDLREKLLAAAEKKVDTKIAELKAIEANIKGLLRQKDEEEEAQISSLVKVYESMKAKDAARIFERLDNDILLDVAMRMKEQKVAAIMAAMSADTAENLTVLLATSISESSEIPLLQGDEGPDFGANG